MGAIRDETGASGVSPSAGGSWAAARRQAANDGPFKFPEPPAGVPARLQRIVGTATVCTTASQEAVHHLGTAVHRRCPVANMVEDSGCALEIRWVAAPP